jgi:hypothetical protein
VREGWRRGLVGIQLHGETGGLVGGPSNWGFRRATVGAAPDDCAVGCSVGERGRAAVSGAGAGAGAGLAEGAGVGAGSGQQW